jgi:Ca2+-binding RTX toxin-like protein
MATFRMYNDTSGASFGWEAERFYWSNSSGPLEILSDDGSVIAYRMLFDSRIREVRLTYEPSPDEQNYLVKDIIAFWNGSPVFEVTGLNKWVTAVQFRYGFSVADMLPSENDTFYGAGKIDTFNAGAGNDTIFAGGSNDVLHGEGGDDVLDGETGQDVLHGGNGADTYFVGQGDIAIEEGTDGAIDLVRTPLAQYTLGARLDDLVFDGLGAFKGTGNTLDNIIQGGFDGDTLDGAYGIDTLIGGFGDDTYVVDSTYDVTHEIADGGMDLVESWSSYYALGDEVEDLVYGGYGNFAGVGNSKDNRVLGGSGTDTLDGAGGSDALWGEAGADVLYGGAGHDWLIGGSGSDTVAGGGGDDNYIVEDASDLIDETAGQGTDTVYASVSYTLAASAAVEFLSTTDAYAATSLNLAGNSYANSIYGNAGANRLDGRAGADKLYGNGGNDTYFVDNTGDRVVEPSTGGTADRVYTTVSHTLSSYVEGLYASGTAAISLTGNTAANVIYGNSGANKINGGYGNDTLKGSTGKDVFIFSTKLSTSANRDTIVDFSVADDSLYLDNAIFTKLGSGSLSSPKKLSSSYFTVGSAAKDKNDYVIYNKSTGVLSYDADGSGSAKAVEVAKLVKGLAMTYSDIYIV